MTNMPFVELLTVHRGGELEAACSEKLDEIGAAMRDHGGKASLTLKLDFKKTKHGHIEVDAKVTAKIPEPELRPSIFFMTEDGRFSRRDPSQTDIEDIPGVRRPLAPFSTIRAAE